MSTAKSEVWVTGIGLVSSLGEGLDTHWAQLTSGKTPVPSVDTECQAPYPVHPIVEIDIAAQIPKRSDQRQMGPWQHLGTYAAGLALDDAGIAHNADLLAKTNMIVAAGGGERDIEVDTAIMEKISASDNPGVELNASLSTELRPTLFLAQLSNLMAGNISIVHGVTDSSRTFMGEETAGVTAIETAVAQIQNGQGDIFLVGGAYIAERADLILLMEYGHALWRGDHGSVWSRENTEGGMIMGSAGAFLILESRAHAEARGAKPYARINKVVSDRCTRQAGAARKVADGLLEQVCDQIPEGPLPVLSGCSGIQPQLTEERGFLESLSERGIDPSIRGVTTLFGNSIEAQFPVNVALASLAISKGAFFDPFDDTGVEQDFYGKPERILISTWGHWRGEALGLVDTPDGPLRGDE
ncbi:beta-ketoacyl-ACP synthase [Pseudomonadota bacterium]